MDCVMTTVVSVFHVTVICNAERKGLDSNYQVQVPLQYWQTHAAHLAGFDLCQEDAVSAHLH